MPVSDLATWALAGFSLAVTALVTVVGIGEWLEHRRIARELRQRMRAVTPQPAPIQPRPVSPPAPPTWLYPADRAKVGQTVSYWRQRLEALKENLDVVFAYDVWLGCYTEALGILERLASPNELFNEFAALCQNETLNPLENFGRYLERDFGEINWSLEQRDASRCSKDFERLLETLRKLETLTKSWHELRDIAAQGITTAPEARVSRLEYEELRHGIEITIRDRDTGELLAWNPWTGLLDIPRMDRLVECLADRVRAMRWARIDILCSMCAETMPLTSKLAADLKKEHIVADNVTYNLQPRDFREWETVLLIDSSVQAGSHLQGMVGKYFQSKAGQTTFAGAICVVMNDWLPEDREQLPIVSQLIQEGKLIYLFKLSELCRRKRVLDQQRGAQAAAQPPTLPQRAP